MGAPAHPSWRRRALLGTTALLLIAGGVGGLAPSAHADFNDGTVAYQAGDYTRAYNEWLPLARAGNAAAQRNIGQLYRLGLGVPKDLKVAANWYRLAAEQGLARAQANLGVMYLRGEGVERDPQTAAQWFQKAAEQGHAISQYNLALMFEQGYGVGRNRSQAAKWFERAAEGGHDKAGERLASLLADAVVPAAGAPTDKPAPAQPVQTARSEEYLPDRILNRRKPVDPPPAPAAAPTEAPAARQVADATPAADDNSRDKLTEALTAPPSPADLAGTPAARFAVRPESRAPQQVAKLPEAAPEANSLSRPAFLRPTQRAAREDKPVDVALGAAESPIPARRRPAPAPTNIAPTQAKPIIEVPVAPFLKKEAQATDIVNAPPAPVVETPVAPFLKKEAQASEDMPASPAIPIPPVQIAAITPPPVPVPKPATQAKPAAITAPSPDRVKPVPDFLQREAMSPPPELALRQDFGPNSYLVPREIPVVVRLDAIPPLPPRKPAQQETTTALSAPAREEPAPPTPRETPALLARESENQLPVAPADMPRERKDPVQVAALPAVPRPDVLSPAEAAKTESPFGSRIPLFYARQADALAAAARAEMTQLAALSAVPTAPAVTDKPVPAFLRKEAELSAAQVKPAAVVVKPRPVPEFLREEARAADEPDDAPLRLPKEKPAPPFLREEVMGDDPSAPALQHEQVEIESEDDAPDAYGGVVDIAGAGIPRRRGRGASLFAARGRAGRRSAAARRQADAACSTRRSGRGEAGKRRACRRRQGGSRVSQGRSARRRAGRRHAAYRRPRGPCETRHLVARRGRGKR